MGMTQKMQAQGGCPSGFLGVITGWMMNLFHAKVYRWGLAYVGIRAETHALDIGCGGGRLMRELSRTVTSGKICGIDHSDAMVRMAQNSMCEVKKASVSNIPYGSGVFDLVTAFETIQFWPDTSGGLKEIRRVLKPSGELLIVNRYPEPGSKWADFLKLKSKDDYRRVLDDAGFADISADCETRPGWIRIKATTK